MTCAKQIIRSTASYTQFTKRKKNGTEPIERRHSMGQNQQEANKGMLHNGKHSLSQAPHKPSTQQPWYSLNGETSPSLELKT